MEEIALREHIEFVQAQHLDWQDGATYGRPGTDLKLLSIDGETGAFSCVMRFPEGWRDDKDAWLLGDEELFVLDGELMIDGTSYAENCYAFLPAGLGRGASSAPRGAVALCFFSRALGRGPNTTRPEVLQDRIVRKIDVAEGQWDGDFDALGLGKLKAGARLRVLRTDPLSGETTYISASIAFRRGTQAERHPIVQEFFLLSGELAGETGVMQAGAYCFRPPMFKHGPYGSPTGAVILFRGLGGPQETFWEEGAPLSFKPAHAPLLPNRLRKFGQQQPRPPRY